jgi:hypothetical protein
MLLASIILACSAPECPAERLSQLPGRDAQGHREDRARLAILPRHPPRQPVSVIIKTISRQFPKTEREVKEKQE